MRVLIDTNVLMDYLAKREPYFATARNLINACMEKKIDGYIAAHSILNLFFVLRHDYTTMQRRIMLMDMCRILHIVNVNRTKIITALIDDSFSDFEDCVQYQCAASCQADYIVTRNLKDFRNGVIPAVMPDDFCQRILENLSDGQGDE